MPGTGVMLNVVAARAGDRAVRDDRACRAREVQSPTPGADVVHVVDDRVGQAVVFTS